MKVLLLGSGGREHAIAWKLTRDDPSVDLIAAPGNPGIEELGRCVRLSITDAAAVCALADAERPDLVIVGPEAPLAAGVSDALRARGHAVFGPSQAAAQLESSKRYAKQVMLEHGIPTGVASWHVDHAQALAATRLNGAPVVIKASGLAAGKGVVVAATMEEAEHALDDIMLRSIHGASGAEVLVEEYLEGEELSVFALTDGSTFVVLPAAQDHKRLLDGDRGPNTGGMGAYSPVSLATASLISRVCDEVIEPTLAAMRKRSTPFQGLLYCGLMLTADGPKVIEFNCRFGDPETQVVLPLLDANLAELCLQSAGRSPLGPSRVLPTSGDSAVTTVVAAPGYPEAARTGGLLTLPHHDDVLVFHAGTGRNPDGALVASGGRVLAVTGVAPDFQAACRRSREVAAEVVLDGAMLRSDIGWRELARRAGAS